MQGNTDTTSVSDTMDNIMTFSEVGSRLTKPKHRLTAYNFFFRAERAKLLGIDPDAVPGGAGWKRGKAHRKTHGKISFSDLGKQVATNWRQLGPDLRATYEKKAAADAARYKGEMKAYKEALLVEQTNVLRQKELQEAEVSARATLSPKRALDSATLTCQKHDDTLKHIEGTNDTFQSGDDDFPKFNHQKMMVDLEPLSLDAESVDILEELCNWKGVDPTDNHSIWDASDIFLPFCATDPSMFFPPDIKTDCLKCQFCPKCTNFEPLGINTVRVDQNSGDVPERECSFRVKRAKCA